MHTRLARAHAVTVAMSAEQSNPVTSLYFSPFMPLECFNVYRDQLSSLYQGVALWEPNPIEDAYDQVSIGDVGYVHEGFFYRMFNVTLPPDDPSNNRLGKPDDYTPLDCGPFVNIRKATITNGDHYSRYVSIESRGNNVTATNPNDPNDPNDPNE
jgi:hypothetical protein